MHDENHERGARAREHTPEREGERQREAERAMSAVATLRTSGLFARASAARRILRDARRRIGTVGGLAFVDMALDETERLLPGLMDRADDDVTRAVRRLSPSDRGSLRIALVCGGDVADDALRALGVTARQAVAAIDHVDVYDAVAAEVLTVLRAFEQSCAHAC